MSDECEYYYYQSSYCCEAKREQEGRSSIDSDRVHKYCWGYGSWEDCKYWKKEEEKRNSSSCFLTSACVKTRGMADDCYELTVLRHFRDNYMASLPTGKMDILEYYATAPLIVAAINKEPNATDIFNQMYIDLVVPCVELIESGQLFEAYTCYKEYTKMLQVRYL